MSNNLIGKHVVGGGRPAIFLDQSPYPNPKSEGGTTPPAPAEADALGDMLAAAGHGRPKAESAASVAVVAMDRFVRCYRAASLLGHANLEVQVRAPDARRLFRHNGDWCCKEQCGFSCFE